MITREEYERYHEYHINMWYWLAENPCLEKIDYINDYLEYDSDDLRKCCECFACMIAENVTGSLCWNCPIKQGCKIDYFNYLDAQAEQNYDKVSMFAGNIADAPWLSYEEWVNKVNQNKKENHGS